jgi:hypothetical protein
MPDDEAPLALQRRATLAAKGRLLFGKYCGTQGRGICAESFAVYHLGQGETAVAEDLVAFLEERAAALESFDPEGRLAMTRGLVGRIRKHLAAARGEALPQTGPALRRFVKDGG